MRRSKVVVLVPLLVLGLAVGCDGQAGDPLPSPDAGAFADAGPGGGEPLPSPLPSPLPLPSDQDAGRAGDDAGLPGPGEADGGTGPGVTPASDAGPTVDAEEGPDLVIGATEDGGSPADGPAPAPTTPPASCPSYRLRHLQASMQRTDTVAQRNASIDAAFDASADTISWTEIENLSDAQHIDARRGWATFWPSGRVEAVARNAIPISWRTDTFELVRGRSWKASDGLAMVSPSRWVTRVWLRHLASGVIQSRVSHHAVSGVDGDGEDPVAWRREAHAQDIAKFREVMLLESVPVVGSGDFNTVRLRSLLGGAFKYDVPDSGGSHGTRLIDWIVRRPHPDLTFVSVRFIDLANSDHRGVRAGYDYRPACP